jgi:hypothetical protein
VTAEFENGALGSIDTSRFAPGRKNHHTFEIYGSDGSIVFDLERMNELQVFSRHDPAHVQGFRTVLATESVHPYVAAWWPPGHTIGYEHAFHHAVVDFVRAITDGTPRCARTSRTACARRWCSRPRCAPPPAAPGRGRGGLMTRRGPAVAEARRSAPGSRRRPAAVGGVIDRDSPVPYYHQLKELLRDEIASGRWPAGSAIPSEPELCRVLDVSRTVVRQALGDLGTKGCCGAARASAPSWPSRRSTAGWSRASPGSTTTCWPRAGPRGPASWTSASCPPRRWSPMSSACPKGRPS